MWTWLCTSSFLCVFSDVYVFGIGEEVKKDQLNALASQKRNEMHVFILKNFKTLGQVFNSIISKEITLNSKTQKLVCFLFSAVKYVSRKLNFENTKNNLLSKNLNVKKM